MGDQRRPPCAHRAAHACGNRRDGCLGSGMDTASQVLVATFLAVAIGVVIGHLGGGEPARGAAAASAARHPPDASPARVHHPVHLPDAGVADPGRGRLGPVRDPGGHPAGHERPARGLAGGGRGRIGVRASRMQVLAKVKLPLARDSIMLGVNQGIIMVLAVVVIGGSWARARSATWWHAGCSATSSAGVVASLAILALGIALDRVTQGRRGTQQELPARRPARGLGLRRTQVQPQ